MRTIKKIIACLVCLMCILMCIFPVNVLASSDAKVVAQAEQHNHDKEILDSMTIDAQIDNMISMCKKSMSKKADTDLFYTVASLLGNTINPKDINIYLTKVALAKDLDIEQQAMNVINVSFCGYKADNILGEDMIADILSYTDYENATIEELAYSLIALDSFPYKTLAGGKVTRQTLVRGLLEKQNPDNGFGEMVSDKSSSITTALVIIALADYAKFDPSVKTPVNLALDNLKSNIHYNGAVINNKAPSSIATARTIVAIEEMGKSIEDKEFVCGENTLLDGLKLFLTKDGGFSSYLRLEKCEKATQEAVFALLSLKKQKNIFDLNKPIESYNDNVIHALQMSQEQKDIVSGVTKNENKINKPINPENVQNPDDTKDKKDALDSIKKLTKDFNDFQHRVMQSEDFKYVMLALVFFLVVFFVLKNELRFKK